MSASSFRWQLASSVILNYGIAIVSAATAVALTFAFERLAGSEPSIALLLCAVMVVGLICGAGPALLATALTAAALEYFFLQPVYSFALELKELPSLALFAVAALLVVYLSAAQQRAAGSLKRARDELQGTVRKLRELNEALCIENAERRQAEAKARQAERQLQVTIDTIPVLAARYRSDGFMEFRNQNWRDYTGLSKENLEGGRWGSALHPDDVPLVEGEWRKHIATGEPFDLEQRLRRADGEYRWHWVRRAPLRDENGLVAKWYGVALDIDDRKRAETALRQSETELAAARHELQLLVDTIPALVLRHRADGIIDFVNQAVRRYSGFDPSGWTTRSTDTTHPDDVSRLGQAWDAALASGQPFETEQRVRRADGEYRWFATRRVPLRNRDGDVVAWYAASFDIEDRKRADEALRASEAQLAKARRELELTLDSIPTLAWRARPDGYAEYLNRRWLDYTGLSPEQALGWEWQAAIHPDDRARLREAWLGMLESGKPSDVEARMRRSDGADRWFLFRTEALRDDAGDVVGWYGTNTDIEDRKQMESALQRSEAYSAEAQKLSQTGSIAWDVVNDEHFWSEETYQIMGFNRSVKPTLELIGQRVHPDDRARLRRQARRAAQGAHDFDYQQRLLMPDGQIKHLHIRAHRVRYGSGREEIVGALMDVTTIKRSQEALDAAHAALSQANRLATLGEVSATIAHEVNQPLAAIVANGQACLRFLRRDPPDLNDVRGAMEWIIKDGNRASEIIRRVRGLLKKVGSDKVQLDVNDVLREVAVLLQRELNARNVTLQLQLPPIVSSTVADRVQIQQVVINLIMNGAEAMQEITDRPRLLVVRCYEDDEDRVVIAVKDNGVGIAAGIAEHLFDPFFTTKPHGLGIGLSICRSIIQDHGGQLWVTDNGDGPGAAFRFNLPARRSAAT